MDRRDLREILRIEADSFRHPWSERDFIEHFENPYSVALVVERSRLILGYEVFGIHAPWIQLYSCVVHRGYRRQAIGSQLVTSLGRQVADGECAGIVAKIPERNLAAQLFLRKCGFRAVKIARACRAAEQDTYVMTFSLAGFGLPNDASAPSEDELIPLWEVKHG